MEPSNCIVSSFAYAQNKVRLCVETGLQAKGAEKASEKETSFFSDSIRKPVSKKKDIFFIYYIHQTNLGKKRDSSVSIDRVVYSPRTPIRQFQRRRGANWFLGRRGIWRIQTLINWLQRRKKLSFMPCLFCKQTKKLNQQNK